MLAVQTETFDQFVYDGAIGWPHAIVALAVLGGLLAWLSFRERSVTGTGLALLFLLLRLSAVGLVLWMLLGPTQVEKQRTTLPSETALLLDVSESMQAPASLGTIDTLRWRYAAGVDNSPLAEMLAAVDSTAVAAWIAEHNVNQAVDAGGTLASEEFVGPPLQAAQLAIQHAIEQLEQVIRANTDPRLSQSAEELAAELRNNGLPAFADALAQLSADETDADLANQTLEYLKDDIAQWRYSAESLQREAVTAARNRTQATETNDAPEHSRQELARLTLEQIERDVLSQLESETNIRRISVDQSAAMLTGDNAWKDAQSPGASDAQKTTTNLSSPWDLLRKESQGDSLTAAFLLSDGAHNDATSAPPAAAAAGLGLPVFTAALADGRPQRDLSIYRVNVPQTVALNDEIVVEAIVAGEQLDGEQVVVELRSKGEVIDRRDIQFTGNRQDQRVRLTTKTEEIGRREYELAVAALPFEASDKNNTADFAVRTVRDVIRVALADGIAHREFHYLDQLWRRDPRVEYDKLLLAPALQATGGLASTQELPRTLDGWSRYDVVILGDLDPSALDYQQQAALADWVQERGGTVVAIAGQKAMPGAYKPGPLLSLLPVEYRGRASLGSRGYVVAMNADSADLEPVLLTDETAESEKLWADQYHDQPIYDLSPWTRLKPSAHAVLFATPRGLPGVRNGASEQSPDTPALLSWQSSGAGRVVFLAAPATWHLRYRRGDELHHRFWGQMLRWLTEPQRGAGDSDVFIGLSSSLVEFGESLQATVTIVPSRLIGGTTGLALSAVPTSGEPIVVNLTPDTKTPGRFAAEFKQLPPGAYRVRVEGLPTRSLAEDNAQENSTAAVTVAPPRMRESLDLAGNRPLLREIAAASGGCELPPTAVGAAIRLTAAAPRVVEESARTPLWNRWRFFWIVVGCLATEWSIRRWIGLI